MLLSFKITDSNQTQDKNLNIRQKIHSSTMSDSVSQTMDFIFESFTSLISSSLLLCSLSVILSALSS